MNIKRKHGTPYSPTTTSLVERFNKTLVTKLRKITEFGKFDWARCLEKANEAYKYSYHRAIDCDPIELLEGKILTTMDRQENLSEKKPRKFFIDRLKDHSDRYKKSYETQKENLTRKKQ
ncbi:hypothetical protein NGRA_3262 [Nosema granulosis]|uniref:Integrase catalytic domain-containing protein n=1 Tax=Nosema granulosis TaxID=83296 RepID=A0A9P6GW55_9MICR|nr:hypothetical protein NGRA_3262 [Nosema granulosis]